MKRSGFVMSELLMAIGTISAVALIFIMYMTFGRARENARRASCQSNLKQIALGFKEYIQDYDGFYPRYDIANVGCTVSGSFTITHWVQALQSYTKSVMIFQCPSDSGTLGTDYYFSRVVSGRDDKKFHYSATTVLLTEGADISNCVFATATAPITGGKPPAFARHLDGSNYCFLDGHVKWLYSGNAPSNASAFQGGFTFNS